MLIKGFFDIVHAHSDIPENFIIAGAYSIISQTIGRYFVLHDFSDFRPNIFIIVASAPRFTRRGELMKCVKVVTQNAFITFYGSKDEASNEIKAHMLEGGSPEGLIDDINYFKENGVNSYCLSSTEFGRLLSGIKSNKSYMAGMDALLCKLYSAESYYQSFSNRRTGEYNPRHLEHGTYFNIFGTMQKPNNYLDEKMSNTGLMRRLSLFSVNGIEVIDQYKPPLGRDTKAMYAKLKELGEKIGNKMIELDRMYTASKNLLLITYSKDVRDKYNAFDEEVTRLAKSDDENPYYLYKQGQFDQMLKFSMLRAIAEGREVLTMQDYERAKKHVEVATEDLQTILESTLIPKEQKIHEDNLKRILKYTKQGLDNRTIQQRMGRYGVHAEELHDLYKVLLKDNKIKMKKDGNYEVL